MSLRRWIMVRFVRGILTRRVSWANWQFGPLKLAMLALGIVVGAYFADLWKSYLWLAGLIFVILATWVTMMWMGAMRGAA
jgi:hypothetical protein